MNSESSHTNGSPEPAGASTPERWVDVHGDVLYRYARTRVPHPETAEDLVQETLLSAWKDRDRFEGKSSERTWLIGILRHKIMDHYRARSRRIPETDQVSHEDWLGAFFDEHGRWIARPDPDAVQPEILLEREEFWEVFHECLDGLPARHREAFARRVIEHEDTKAICKALDVTATNLWVILFRARTRMRHCLTLKWFNTSDSSPDTQ